MNDKVNHPSHYTSHPSGVECIEITQHYDFCVGNAMKYLWRHGLKEENGMTDTEKAIEDLKKAVWYINNEIKLLGGDEKQPQMSPDEFMKRLKEVNPELWDRNYAEKEPNQAVLAKIRETAKEYSDRFLKKVFRDGNFTEKVMKLHDDGIEVTNLDSLIDLLCTLSEGYVSQGECDIDENRLRNNASLVLQIASNRIKDKNKYHLHAENLI